MKVTLPLLLLAAVLGCAASTEVICYWGSWSHYRTGAGTVTAEDLDPHMCTIYIYSFAKLNPSTYKMEMFDSWLDDNLRNYQRFLALKQKNPALKLLVALGGWNDSLHPKYSIMLANPSLRAAFTAAAVQFVQQHGFDGLDLDYEYPTAADKPHFAAWVSELRAAFQPHGLLLTAAVAASAAKIDAGYDVPILAAGLDFINVMAYDLHGSWEANADHHAPLAPRPSDNGNGLDVQSVMAFWMSRGAPASKLSMGVPLYGRSWTVPGADKTPPAAGSGAGLAGPHTMEAGSLSYFEICQKIGAGGWTVVQDPTGKIGPYAYSGNQWVGYDDTAMVATKTQWAVGQGFGAVMVWDVSSEDVRNGCGGGAWPLMSAINANLGSTTPATTTTTAGTTTTTAGTTAGTTTTTAGTTTTTTAGTTTTTTAGTTTTTAAPGGSFSCPTANGLFPDPADCQSYYNCGHGTPYHYTCPAGTLFDPTALNCNWANQVSCSVTSGGDASTTTTTTTTTTTAAPGGFSCPSPNGWFADPADCHSFYNCFDGTPNHYTCPAGTSWQQSITNCNWSSITGC